MVRSRPVVDRVPVDVIKPVDVAVTSFGDTLIADEAANLLLRVNRLGESGVLASDLDGISRVADSDQLGTHVLLSKGRSGRIFRFTDNGIQLLLAYLPFEPAGLGIDPEGNLLTTNRRSGEVVRIRHDGQIKVIATVSEPTKDLVVDQFGNALVLLTSGKVVTVFADDSTRTAGYVPSSASRLEMHPKNYVVALASDEAGKPVLTRLTANRGPIERVAGTPSGTVAFTFDKLGNLTLANPELRGVTRVTSRFEVKCQHCQESMLMILSPDAPLPDFNLRRSF